MMPTCRIHKRRSLRLPGYDYSQAGAYFVTTCVVGRKGLLGEIVNGEMRLNEAGHMTEKWWLELEKKFPLIETDEFVVMPNHFHGIIVICPEDQPEQHSEKGAHTGAPLQRILQWFKTMSTNEYIHGVKEHGWKPFPGKLWQRGYYEHVIRNDAALNHIREYIASNPQHWDLDGENPLATGRDEFDLWLATFETRPIETRPPQTQATRRGGSGCPPANASAPSRQEIGKTGEDLAAAALKKQGYKILERNYRTPLGEIDLIARHRGDLVFVEIKTRRSARFGQPQEAISAAKQGRLQRLAAYYLNQKGLTGANVRFDAVAIVFETDGPRIEIIPQAFGG